jgi:hypothetical protein
MWASLALAAALGFGFGQTGQLTISNIRPTYGVLGPRRPDDRILPGDLYLLSFDVDGLKAADDGKVKYTMAMEIVDSAGKIWFPPAPRDLEQVNSLGSGRIQAFPKVEADLKQPPGEYTMKVTVTDRVIRAEKTLTRKFEVRKPEFGLVRPTATYDPDAQIPASLDGVVGQSIWLHCYAVHFGRDAAKKELHVTAELRVKDANGNPTVAKPFSGEYKLTDELLALPMRFLLVLNRPGKFTIELNATDHVDRKKSTLTLPLTVIEPKQ